MKITDEIKNHSIAALGVGIAVIAASTYALSAYKKHRRFKDLCGKFHSTQRWDKTDEASWESFPASDPPAYW